MIRYSIAGALLLLSVMTVESNALIAAVCIAAAAMLAGRQRREV